MSDTHPLNSGVADALWRANQAAGDLRVLGPSSGGPPRPRVVVITLTQPESSSLKQTRAHGHPGTRAPGHPGTRAPGHPGTRAHGHTGTRTHDRDNNPADLAITMLMIKRSTCLILTPSNREYRTHSDLLTSQRRTSASSGLVVITLSQPESSSLKKHDAHDKKINMSDTHPLKSGISDALRPVNQSAEDVRVLGPSRYYSQSTRVIIFKEARCS
jgi:hypothetical protein